MKRLNIFLILALAVSFGTKLSAQVTNSYKFSFGTAKAKKGFTRVVPGEVYSKEKGFGFDFNTAQFVKPVKNGITSTQPLYFSVHLPEGNYHIKMTLGNDTDSSVTTVRIESRRLLVERLALAPGKSAIEEFTVNLRKPVIAGTKDTVKLKQRELGKLDWDDKLTFEFNDRKPCIRSLEITPENKAVTVYLAGNSTVVDQDDEPWASWGQMIPRFFKPGVSIANHAESGLSLGSFNGSKRLEKVLSTLKAGDYLFIEFGHNDQKEKGPNDGAYKSYSQRMKMFIEKTREKGGIPVVVTPANRRTFDLDGTITNSLAEYPDAGRKIAQEMHVALIDLNAMTKQFYEALGRDRSKKAFVIYPAGSFPGQKNDFNDNTHFNGYGAYELAKCVIKGIKENNLDLARYLVDSEATFDPSKPDPPESFYLPLSPRSSVVKPDGN